MQEKYVVFISTMGLEPWGGSEELWAGTARYLAKRKVKVVASVHGWPEIDSRILDLSNAGVQIRPRYYSQSFSGKLARQISGKTPLAQDVEKAIGGATPNLVLISEGGPFPPIEILDMCVSKGWPFAIVIQANCDQWWVKDEIAARYRKLLPLAKRFFFVSEANRVLEEKQLGYVFENAEVIRNPVNLEKIDAPIPWPPLIPTGELRMACVARHGLSQKGQDLLIEALAGPRWSARNWRLAFYGKGPNTDCLERLIRRLNLSDRVVLRGHLPVEQIWRENHVLIMPSRFEGLPLTIVEAMLCGRPVVATNVGGNAEVVEDGVTGFLAETPSVENIAGALERMWVKREFLQEMGHVAVAKIRDFLPRDPIEVFAQKLLAYFQ